MPHTLSVGMSIVEVLQMALVLVLMDGYARARSSHRHLRALS
jgi:hypothetical protein